VKKAFYWLKDRLLRLKAFAKHASSMLFSGKAFRRAETKTRTVFSFIFYSISLLALVPSMIHLAFDMMTHGTAMVISAVCFAIGQKIHGPYMQEA
jgi:hypothetical protein